VSGHGTRRRAGARGKQSLYFPEEMLAELQAEAQRLDRSVAWLVERAWKIAKRQVMSLSTEDDTG
jgi:uncharacterized small protein (TIGR04563 family)